MRIITDIYKEYKINIGLANHMLRVASVASIICDSINIPLDKQKIIETCLLHDMGNIIKFDFNYFPEFWEPEGVDYWKGVKDEYVKKYGDNEHLATIAIMKELNCSQDIVSYADQIRFSFLCKHSESDDFYIKVIHYADSRVGPLGVISFEERMADGKKRYENRKGYFGEESDRQTILNCGREIEKQIFTHCKIKPEDINDESIKDTMESLKSFKVK